MRSYLIVANQTLSGAHLLREVQTRSQAEECRFHVVVPATPATGHTNWTEGAAHAQAQAPPRRGSGAVPRGRYRSDRRGRRRESDARRR